MSDPIKYSHDYSFTDWQANNPTSPPPGVQMDSDFNAVEASIDEIVDAVKDVRRSDGALQNGIVTTDSLDSTLKALFVLAGFTFRGAWVTGTVYNLKDFVQQNGTSYLCAIPHTSGTFATDVADGKWLSQGAVIAANVAVSAVGNLVASNAQAAFAELDSDLTAETSARQTADTNLSNSLNSVSASVSALSAKTWVAAATAALARTALGSTTVGDAVFVAADAATAKTALNVLPQARATSAGPASIELAEDTDNGTHKVTISAPASLAADVAITMPSATGTLATLAGAEALTNKSVNGVTLTTGGSATAFLNGAGAYVSASGITAGTAQNSTSGTTIDFTGIPSTARRITIILSGVSTNGTSNLLVQVGNGSFVTTGYAGSAMNTSGSGLNTINATNGLQLQASMDAPTGVVHGQIVATKITGNTWVLTATWGRSDAAFTGVSSATIALAGALDRVRVTSVSGDTYDAGVMNCFVE